MRMEYKPMDLPISTNLFSSSSSSAQAFSITEHTKPLPPPFLSSALFVSYKANMGVITYSLEIPSGVAPSRMFKAVFLESHNVLPKILPEGIKSIEFIEGDGGVGSIKKTNFGEKSHIKYIKHKVEALDTGSFYCKFTMIESDVNFDKIDFIVEEVKFIAAGSGCVCKMTSEYHVKEGCELKEEDIKKGKDKAMGFYKAVEEYLVANPDICA